MPKVLIVDDDFIIRDLFKRVLSEEGFEVLTAETGEECLKIISMEGPQNINAVFLDLKMPGIGGENTLAVLKKVYKNLPIVVITAYGAFLERSEEIKKQVVQYVPKPFDIDEIKSILREKIIPGIK